MTGGVAPGWYPDYEAPTGHQRYWDGQGWTEQRSVGLAVEAAAPAGTATATKEREPAAEPPRRARPSAPPSELPEPSESAPAVERSGPRLGVWLATAAAAVLIGAFVVLVVRDWAGSSDPGGSSSPPPASQPGTAGAAQGGDEPRAAQRTWEVAAVVDGTTIELANGAQVRLAGLAESCSTEALAQLVVEQRVTLVRKGADKDADGHLLRYVERDGLDVGLRLVQRGYATASSEPNPRGAIYRKVDARIPSAC